MEEKDGARLLRHDALGPGVQVVTDRGIHMSIGPVEQAVELRVQPVVAGVAPGLGPPEEAEHVGWVGVVVDEDQHAHGDLPLEQVLVEDVALLVPDFQFDAQRLAEHGLHRFTRDAVDARVGHPQP